MKETIRKKTRLKQLLVAPFLTSLLSLAALNLFAAEGTNIVFDKAENGGQPLNYKRLGCLIHKVTETLMSSSQYNMYDVHTGIFDASGDLNACKTVCANYTESFSTTKWGSKVSWLQRNWLAHQTWDSETPFQCAVDYSSAPNTIDSCPNGAGMYCRLKPSDYPLPPPPTCSMSLNRYIGDPTTEFLMKTFSATSAVACEVEHKGVIKPIGCANEGAPYSLGKNTVGSKSVTFRALGFGSDANCTKNYTVYKTASCVVQASTDGGASYSNSTATLDLSSNTSFKLRWSTTGDAIRCDYFKDGVLMQKGIACNSVGSYLTKDLYQTLGDHRVELVVRGQSGNDFVCKQNFKVVP